jgi:hypothetical protein
MRRPHLGLLGALLITGTLGPIAHSASAGSTVTDRDRQQMSRLIDEYLAVYDPGRIDTELEVLSRVFDTGPDFLMVVDAVTYPSWESREARIRERAQQPPVAGDREGVHDTVTERIVALGPDAATLTRVYRYRFTNREGVKGHQDGAITCVFSRRGGAWKVIQYHGSHRPRVTAATAPGR